MKIIKNNIGKEMNVIHITHERNINSIFKKGILRNKPFLYQYNEVMESLYGSNYDTEKGLIFAFPEEVTKRDKYIKDFCYWKTWGDCRNDVLNKLSYKEFEEYQEEGCNIFSNIKPVLQRLNVLLLDIEYEEVFGYYLHSQNNIMSNYWTDMDYRYEHDDKPLVLINYDVKINQIKRIMGTVESFDKNKKINITLNI